MSVSERIKRLESQSSIELPNSSATQPFGQKSPAVSPVTGRHLDGSALESAARDSESTRDLMQLMGPPNVESEKHRKERPPLPKKPTSFSAKPSASQLDKIQRPTLNPASRAKTINTPRANVDDRGPIILIDNENAQEPGDTAVAKGPHFSDFVDDQLSPDSAVESPEEQKERRNSLQKIGDNASRLTRNWSDNMVTKRPPKPISTKLVGAKLSQTFDPIFKNATSGGKIAFAATRPVRDSVSQTFKEAGDATKLAMNETGISKASMMVADDATDAAAKTIGKEGEGCPIYPICNPSIL